MRKAHRAIGGIPLCLGGNVFGWTLDRDGSFAVLDAFYEAGGRMIDTAEGYSSFVPGNKGGESETIIGAWMELRGVRGDMLIGTKTGMGGIAGALEPEKVRAALAGSLERLRTDYVDLYYVHRDDLTTPLDEVVDVYDVAFRSGQARELGGSNYTADRLAAILDTAGRRGAQPFTVLQPQYNLVVRELYEGPLQDLCVARGIAALPFYGLQSGFLSGKYRAADQWQGAARAHALDAAARAGGWDVLAVMDVIVNETGASHAAVALSWLIAQPGIAAPLASATSPAQLAELAAAVTLELNADQRARLTAAKPA
jgi:aryl-alcohol dehydrogenase-like predicted oxidoreductase